jgi:hypothetical protein
MLNSSLSDAPLGARSLLFLPEQVPYRVDSVKAYKPQQACWGSFFACLPIFSVWYDRRAVGSAADAWHRDIQRHVYTI